MTARDEPAAPAQGITGVTSRSLTVLALLVPALAGPASGQGIVVDQGEFRVTIAGRAAGSEDFVIRRAALGRDNTVFANGAVTLTVDGAQQEIRPLLRALPLDGTAESYQVRVTGPGAMELRMNRSGRRYVARASSEVGDEDREFAARAETRVLEQDVAHHYYFVRDVREGRIANAIEPRSRRQITLTAGPWVDEQIPIGRNVVTARRVEFADGEDRRIVWYDRQGRVVRVEIPATGYVAERTDLVG